MLGISSYRALFRVVCSHPKTNSGILTAPQKLQCFPWRPSRPFFANFAVKSFSPGRLPDRRRPPSLESQIECRFPVLTCASSGCYQRPSSGGPNLSARSLRWCTIATLLFAISLSPLHAQSSALRFEISFPKEAGATPLDGHVLLLISTNNKEEPRFQILEDFAESQQAFGLDVDALAPGMPAVVDATTFG